MAIVFDPEKLTAQELRRLGKAMANSSSRREVENNVEMLQSVLVCVALTLADVMDRINVRSGKMQSLLLADDLFPGIHSDLKKNTMRNGKRDIVPGPLEFKPSSGHGASTIVNVTMVKHCKAAEVSEEDCRANGYRDHADMMLGMKRYYSDFGPDNDVTVIIWA